MWTPWQRRQKGMSTNAAVTFPNQSRSYDATRQAIHFWGYDRAMEASFYLAAEALQRIQPNLQQDVAGLLNAFDINRDRIYAAAARVYARGRRGSYDLTVADI